MFGILFSIPVSFVASMVYCGFLANTIRASDVFRRIFYVAGVIILVGFLSEVILLIIFGVLRSREVVGPAFWIAHRIFFFIGTPALANVLLLRKRPLIDKWYLAAILCTVFAFYLVMMEFEVSEILFGIDGMGGPYS